MGLGLETVSYGSLRGDDVVAERLIRESENR